MHSGQPPYYLRLYSSQIKITSYTDKVVGHAEHGALFCTGSKFNISNLVGGEIVRASLKAGVCNISDWQLEPNMNQSMLVNQKFKHTQSLHGFLFFKEHLLLLLANRNRNRPFI